jgi:hypothetical protein
MDVSMVQSNYFTHFATYPAAAVIIYGLGLAGLWLKPGL